MSPDDDPPDPSSPRHLRRHRPRAARRDHLVRPGRHVRRARGAICRLAQALYAHGLRAGDHVAVLLLNDDRTHEVAFGLQRSGLYYTMVNTHLTAEEAAYIVNDCGAHTLITSRRWSRWPGNWSPSRPTSTCG